MDIKKLVNDYRLLTADRDRLAAEHEAVNKQIAECEMQIRNTMTEQGMSSFEAEGFGVFKIVDKVFFNVAADNKDRMLAWFEADPELSNLVKVKKDVHYQSANRIFREIYEDTNTVPDFVTVSPVTQVEFKPFKNTGGK